MKHLGHCLPGGLVKPFCISNWVSWLSFYEDFPCQIRQDANLIKIP